MNSADLKTLTDYTREVADELNLKDWQITVKAELVPDEDGSEDAANIDCKPNCRTAEINYAKKFRELKLDEQRVTVVHELIHCHTDRLEVRADNLREYLGKAVGELWHEDWRVDLEHAVDAIATVIAPQFNHIPWDS